jgi:hypothetical protein
MVSALSLRGLRLTWTGRSSRGGVLRRTMLLMVSHGAWAVRRHRLQAPSGGTAEARLSPVGAGDNRGGV